MRDFNHTIGVLVAAYINDTLEHQKCSACAVGNMIVASGYKFNCQIGSTDATSEFQWLAYIKALDGQYPWIDFINPDEAKKQIECTGYSIDEIRIIEQAFERAPFGYTTEEWNFNGLMAVVDVLAAIHGIDLTTREETKKMFVNN